MTIQLLSTPDRPDAPRATVLTLLYPRLGYTEVLQAEVAAFGIGVLLVKPGATATEFASEIGSGIKVESSEPYQEGILKYVSNMTNLSRSAPNVAISVAVVERVVEAIDGTGSWLGRSYGFATRLGKT